MLYYPKTYKYVSLFAGKDGKVEKNDKAREKALAAWKASIEVGILLILAALGSVDFVLLHLAHFISYSINVI